MNTFAVLVLTTYPASDSEALLDRKPDKKTDPLFTFNMIKQIIGQWMYSIIIILIFHFLGLKILGLDHFHSSTEQKHQNAVVQMFVFNVFVFAQVGNSFNCLLDRKLNIFRVY
jgi:Ca2+-transporting ATPase